MPKKPRTRSQTEEAFEENQQVDDNSSENEGLDETIVDVNCLGDGAASTQESSGQPSQLQSPQQLTDFLSTLSSLKAAIYELKEESFRNNNAIKTLSSQIKESQQRPQDAANNRYVTSYENLPPLTARNVQQTLPETNQRPSLSNYVQFVPPHNCEQMSPSRCLQQPQVHDNFHQLPSLSNNAQPPPSTSRQYATSPMAVPYYYTTNASQYSEFSAKIYHLPTFDGNPEDWPLFFATYEDTNAEFGYTNRQNLIRLQKALLGIAKDSVKSMLIYPENVPLIIEELKFNFGRPELLIKSQLEKIKMYPAITESRLDNILGLATCTKNIVSFFKSAKCENHLMNPTLLEQLVLKLPLSKQYEWAKLSSSIAPFATVEHFSKWIGEMARFCSLMPQFMDDRRQQMPPVKTRRVLHSKEEPCRRQECFQCKGSHELAECKQFKEMNVNSRWEQVKQFRVCFSCLCKGHNLTQCRKRKMCGINNCSRNHHPILHQDALGKAASNQVEESGHVLQCNQREVTSQLFKVLPVTLHGPNGSFTTYALLDEGSSVSLIEENIANLIGLRGQRSSITLQWYDNMRKTESSMKVKTEISGLDKRNRKYTINNLHTVKELNLPVQSFNKEDFEYLKHLPIANYNNEKPSLLIGLDNCLLGLAEKVIEAGPHLPVASATKLGWVAYGPTSKEQNSVARICHISESSAWKEVHKMVQDYFSVENFGVKATNMVLESEEDKRAKYILKHSTNKIDNRYEIGLLWKNDDTVLPNSFDMAKQRLLNVENKMSRDPAYATNYRNEISKYIAKGYARLLSPAEKDTYPHTRVWYLPHFGVKNPHKPEKLRIVFDAAAITSNVSLNSVLLKGPEHAKPLQNILYQFRQGKVAVAGDIEEMFSQVSIINADQDSQRFLWRNGETKNDIQIYIMQSMIFGAACSPCCAEYVKNLNASKYESTMPKGTKAIIKNTYVDDLVISFNSVEEALAVTKEAIYINAAAGFNLRKFASNSPEVEESLNGLSENGPASLNMKMQDQTNKILGLYWNKGTDSFEFQVRFFKICPDVLKGSRPPTKREVLGIVMAIFDPFGFLANFTICSKLLIQKAWKLCLQWDDPLPPPLLCQWNAWWREFDGIKQFSFLRCYSPFLNIADDVQLHVFVDASSSAYAAVAYLRIQYRGDVQVSFVVAKARCAPPRGMTIPRLELQAAVLGCRIKTSIEEGHDISISRTVLWSDSTTVISWIRSSEREYKQFVACRIAEILSTSEVGQWRWLSTDLNVADEATTAKLPVNFSSDSRWLTGPQFLRCDECLWPADLSIRENIHTREEEKPNRVLVLRTISNPIFQFERFSNFLRVKRTAAWTLRFINIKLKKYNLPFTELSAAELDAGEKLICRQVQIEVYGAERLCLLNRSKLPKTCSIYQLTPYIDDDMLLRVNGRIDNAYYLPDTARNPIIMPTKHQVTSMIIAYYHQKGHHQNDHIVINEVRQKFWVPFIRSVLKSVKKACPVCIRYNAKPTQPLMGQLPIDRLTPYVRPFSYVGLDYCGPFYVAIGRRREKRWIALFTCLSTRALHLEISVDLSSDSFLLCLRNFVNRRGVPVRIRSDNGTNFIGAQKEMTTESRFFDYKVIQQEMSKNNIDWVFNCPSNPHAGGCWERLVRCVKQLLYRIFKEEAPRLETFRSAIIEAECIVNNRPLTQLPINAESEEPLTPNHFILGGLSSTQTPGPADENVCYKKQWRIAQNLKDRLWKRWVTEYLPQLLQRPKWRETSDPIKIGDLVLVIDSNQPRSQWKMGRVTEVYIGKDGQIRSAEVKTATGFIRRPTVKLAIMKVN